MAQLVISLKSQACFAKSLLIPFEQINIHTTVGKMEEVLPAKVGIFLEAEIMAMMMSLGDDVASILEEVGVE